MKKIVIIILSLVMLLLPAMPLHAEDGTTLTKEECDAELKARDEAYSAWQTVDKNVWDLLWEGYQKETEITALKALTVGHEKALEDCLKDIKGYYDGDIKALENEIIRRKEQLAEDKGYVADRQKELNIAEAAIKQWAEQHGLSHVGGQVAGEVGGAAAGVIGKQIIKVVAGAAAPVALGPIGWVSSAITIGLAVDESQHFHDLVISKKMALLRLTEANEKKLETEEAIASKQREINEMEAYIKAGLPRSCLLDRDHLKMDAEEYKTLQAQLKGITEKLEGQKRLCSDLKIKYDEADAKYRECLRGTKSTPTPTPAVNTYDLTVTSSAGGYVTLSSPRGTAKVSSGNTGTDPVVSGTVLTLTATAEPGYEFVGWSGDASGTANTFTMPPMNSNKTVTAHFSKIVEPPGPPPPSDTNFELYTQVGEGCGSVEPSIPQPIRICRYGEQVTIEAWGRENCGKFSHWEIQRIDDEGNVTSEKITPEEITHPTKLIITVTSDTRVIGHFTRR